MTNFKRDIMFLLSLLTITLAWAQGPNGSGTYYKNANGQKGAALKTALFNIISNHSQIGYDGLWTAYETSDVDANGKIIDRYSNITHYDPRNDRAGNYQKEGDCYNREHSFPKSWFGGKVNPMYCDLVHVVPADGYVNNRRGNEPFGETTGNVYKSANGYSKFGTCTSAGYTGNVFEPADEWKGDFARIYLYMATCYENKILSWSACPIVSSSGTKTSPYVKWEMDVLLKWSKQDPVDAREIARNNAVQKLQGNRNPFVDYPGLEDYIWGSKQNVAFSYDNYDGTSTVDPGTDPDNPDNPGTDPDNPDQPTTPTNATEATFIFNTDAGLKELGITKPASNNGTNLSGKSYTKGNVTLTTSKGTGSTDVRVWNSSGSLTFRTYAGNTITFTAAEGYKITSITSNSTSISWSGTATATVTLTPGKVKDVTTITVKVQKEAPTAVNVAISKSGYATLYYSNLTLTIPEGVKAYVYGVTNGELIQDELTGGIISAGEPVVISGNEGTYSFPVSTTAGTKRTDNELLGTDAETAITNDADYYYYMLSYDKNGQNVGFYWGNADGSAFTNGAHRAYLMVPKTNAAGAKGWAFDGSATGIESIDSAFRVPHSAVYNLQGQRVGKNYHGIVIVNGKKVIK